jgi:TRAP-type C4-dicarboxylate transport system permease small subunit
VRKLIHAFTIALTIVSSLCVVAIAVSITLDVTLRQTRGSGVKGVVEYTEILLTALVFLALADGERTRSHIKLVLVTGLLPDRLAQLCRTVGAAVTLGLVVFIAYYSWLRFQTSLETHEFRYGLLRVPTWPARLAIFVGFAALALEGALTLIDDVVALIRREVVAPDPGEVNVHF